ncbi:MAG TPA: hypothetical protein VN700_08075 [Vicinamibacterales bacterium]|nr:hypothetical protein [Vicinamibacterales bacterium]
MPQPRRRRSPWPLITFAALGLACLLRAEAPVDRFVRSADGLTVHDDELKVTWLADANLPASKPFGLPVQKSGSMTYPVARKWLAALNASKYLGRSDWSIPATPATDSGCSVAKGPNGNSFGFDCAQGAMGSLYYRGLGLKSPNTAVPIPPSKVGPFRNFQPYLYWSLNGKARPGGERARRADRRDNGDHTFSFNTGWQGGNVSAHVMYVLPMIPGALPGSRPAPGTELQPSADGQTVYDPIAKVTWLANANLAAENTFGVSGIVRDGAMSRTTADDFIAAMNRNGRDGYLGQKRWQLPPTNPDPSCTMPEGGYDCSGSPMGGLYYNHLIELLHLSAREPVVRAPDIQAGPFHNFQPYLYWSCAGGRSRTQCSGEPAARGFEFSFSFGNGFQGTDVIGNTLYVMVYAPDPKGR